MTCQRCNSPRLMEVSAKCSDMFAHKMPDGNWVDGYVPGDLSIGGGDYVEFTYCLTCGQIQGTFPVAGGEFKEEARKELLADLNDVKLTPRALAGFEAQWSGESGLIRCPHGRHHTQLCDVCDPDDDGDK